MGKAQAAWGSTADHRPGLNAGGGGCSKARPQGCYRAPPGALCTRGGPWRGAQHPGPARHNSPDPVRGCHRSCSSYQDPAGPGQKIFSNKIQTISLLCRHVSLPASQVTWSKSQKAFLRLEGPGVLWPSLCQPPLPLSACRRLPAVLLAVTDTTSALRPQGVAWTSLGPECICLDAPRGPHSFDIRSNIL